MQQDDPIEGDYLPPATQAQPQMHTTTKRSRKGLGGIVATLAVLAAKFKLLLVILTSSWTFFLSLGFYALFFGWQLGVVIILVLAAHELGHYFAYRAYGLHARLPVFVPFVGAFTAGAVAPDLEQDAYIALAGPVVGLALAALCYAIGVSTGERFWLACADISALLNLFNMIPVLPFDGGRVVGAIWAPLWIVGIAIFVGAALWLHVPIFFIVILAAMGLPAIFSGLRGTPDPRSAAMSRAARARVSVWYLATVLALIVVLGHAQSALPSRIGL
jgi:Zn-dependent protease